MRYFIAFLLLACAVSAHGQTNIYSSGMCHTSGPPAFNPTARGCRFDLDTVSQDFYLWKVGTTWVQLGQGVDHILGGIAPQYVPNKWQSTIAVNDSSELYNYTNNAWVCMNCGGGGSTYTAGTGIAINGSNVISNTGDLSATNELNTGFQVTGSNLVLGDAGGNYNVPVTNIAPIQSGTAADFNQTGSVLSLDYTNAQKASATLPGFLTAADWGVFNSKLSSEVDGSVTNELQNIYQTLITGNNANNIKGRLFLQDTVLGHPPNGNGYTQQFIQINSLDTTGAYSNTRRLPNFYMGTSINGGVTFANPVFYEGWNIAPGGSAYDSSLPGIGRGYEGRWRPNLNGTGIDYNEMHDVWIRKTDGFPVRIGSYTCDNQTGYASLYHTVESFSCRKGTQNDNDYFTVQGDARVDGDNQFALRGLSGTFQFDYNTSGSANLTISNSKTTGTPQVNWQGFNTMGMGTISSISNPSNFIFNCADGSILQFNTGQHRWVTAGTIPIRLRSGSKNNMECWTNGTIYGTNFGNNAFGLTPSARVLIAGESTTSSDYALFVTNSSVNTSTAAIAVRNDNTVGIGTNLPTEKLQVAGNIKIDVSGKGLQLKSGTGQRFGNAVLVAGTVTVTNTTVGANSYILLTRKTAGGTIGELTYTISNGASFTINSTLVGDTSTVSYFIFEGN
jgi:hypothetical protein